MRHRSPTVRSVVAVLALGLVVAAGACKADTPDDEDAGPDSSLIPPETTVTQDDGTPSTEAAATDPASTGSTTTAPSTPTSYTGAARDAVEELKAAWEAGDRARAAAIAPGDVVDALFAVPAEGFEVYGCDTGEFETSTCNFRNRSTEAFIIVSAQRSEPGWQIATVDINAD